LRNQRKGGSPPLPAKWRATPEDIFRVGKQADHCGLPAQGISLGVTSEFFVQHDFWREFRPFEYFLGLQRYFFGINCTEFPQKCALAFRNDLLGPTPIKQIMDFSLASAMRVGEVRRIAFVEVDLANHTVAIRDRKDTQTKDWQ